jgi:membrane protease YdiL (CAAX protease family)
MKTISFHAPNVFWMGVLAFALTLLTGGIWLVLLTENLNTTPLIPWAILVMAAVLWPIWQYFNGKWKPESTSGIRRHLMRASPVSKRTLTYSLLAGMFSIIALTGFWIVLSELVQLPGNATLRPSSYPWYITLLVAATASLSGAITEEVAFRGYFQKTLEMKGGPLVVIVTALVMAPAHALTQGFLWPILLFYLLVDAMLGAMAYLTDSILPGIVIHALGLFIFFTLIWPSDSTRRLIFESGADIWFWIHGAQAIVFAVAALLAFKRLTKAVGQ